jgi:hypothetical protein
MERIDAIDHGAIGTTIPAPAHIDNRRWVWFVLGFGVKNCM